MKLKHLGLIVIGASMVSFVAPSALLPFLIKDNAGTEAKPAALDGGLEARRVKYSTNVAGRSGRGNEYTSNYINETKAAVTRKIKERGSSNFEVSKIVFTSKKSKIVAGQRQVALSFTYELKYRNGKPEKKKGGILLVSDEAGNWFDSSISI